MAPTRAEELAALRRPERTGRPLGCEVFVEKVGVLSGRDLQEKKPGRIVEKEIPMKLAREAPKRPWVVLLLIVATSATLACGGIRMDRLYCEYRVDPLGVSSPAPRLRWLVKSTERAQRQTAYRVLAASSMENLAKDRGDLWDSGKLAGADTLNVAYAGRPLVSGQRCYWKVQVWDKNDKASGWSRPSLWEMGLLSETDWTGQWLNDGRANPKADKDFYREDPAPLFRKEFVLAKPVRRARLYLTGLGYYEASVNGQRVGDHALDPGWTKYDRRVFYGTYDVTAQLHAGANCLGVMLGNGWYNPLPLRMWGHLNLREHLPIGRPRFIAQLNLEFADGSAQSVVSDPNWKVGEGPIRFNSIYLGEIYDARKEQPGWDQAGFDDTAWRRPAIAAEAVGALQAQPQPPIRVTERFKAVRVAEPRPGVFIYDLGRNFSGWASFRFKAPAGTKIVMRYGELLHRDGALNPMTSVCGQIKGRQKNKQGVEESVGGPGAPPIAWQSDTYIAKGGGEETYTPRFTFHGFRYVEITGLPGALPLEAVTGLRLNADVAHVGSFVCSNERFNRIQRMCRRTFLANLFSVQSDCPHRERMGYGGDIVAASEALMLNFDMSTFYAKTVQDFADSARPDGMFTDTAPFVGIEYCGVGWAMAHPFLMSQLHRYYGNERLMAEQYEAAKRWLLLVAGQNKDGVIKDGLSDHEGLAPAPAPPLVTPLYFQSARMLAEMARLLGHKDDAARFESLADKSRQAYRKQFFDTATGKAGPGTQASQSFALYSGLVPETDRPKALDFLLENIRGENKGHLSTGIMGTKFMLDALSREGRAEVAYGIVNQADFPGWGWMLENGATTLWEHWALSEDTFSHSHPMFGSVSQWFMNWLGGIQPAPEAVGFDRIIIRPQVIQELSWVRCSYDSVRGKIVSNWRREGGRINLQVEIPFNTTALIFVPAHTVGQVTENGSPISRAPGVELVRTDRDAVVCRVGSGRYSFSVGHAQ